MRNQWLSKGLFLIPIAALGCFQPPTSTDILRKSEGQAVEVSSSSEEFSYAVSYIPEPRPTKRYKRVAQAHAARFGLDWKLVIAVMSKESSFRHDVVSHKGAYGLMQIMPLTSLEIEKRLGIREARTPSNNVKAGAYYLNKLSKNFDEADDENRLKLTLAAYNAGLTRVRDAQRIAEHLGEDKNSWENIRATLPLLSKRFESLHRQIWEDGRPRGGYFGNPTETVVYVERVLGAYDRYALTWREDNSL